MFSYILIRWTDESTSEFRSWYPGEPRLVVDRVGKCVAHKPNLDSKFSHNHLVLFSITHHPVIITSFNYATIALQHVMNGNQD